MRGHLALYYVIVLVDGLRQLWNKLIDITKFKLCSTRAQAKKTHWKFAAFAYYQREKPNLKSLS